MIELFNRQRSVAVPRARLLEFAQRAIGDLRAHPGPMVSVLGKLETIEISIVSDREIARIHREFLGVPGATDVITFPHGEIVMSAQTAQCQAAQAGETVERELSRYIVHGLLHLHGHIDAEAEDAATMWKTQEAVLDSLFPR